MAKKNTFYFQHDSNAREDDKIVALRMEHGSAGYGVYFLLLEILSTSQQCQYERNYNKLGYVLHEQAGLIKRVVENFGLFKLTDDGKFFYSERLTAHMNDIQQLSEARSTAGRMGGRPKKANQNQTETNCFPIENQNETNCFQNQNQTETNCRQNENHKDNIKEKEKKDLSRDARTRESESEEADEKPGSQFLETSALHQELRAELSSDTQTALNAMRLYSLTRQQLIAYLDDFNAKLIIEGQQRKTRADYRHHFNSWLKIQVENQQSKHKTANGTHTPNPAGQRTAADRLHVSRTTTPLQADF